MYQLITNIIVDMSVSEQMRYYFNFEIFKQFAGADPGFPGGGGVNSIFTEERVLFSSV